MVHATLRTRPIAMVVGLVVFALGCVDSSPAEPGNGNGNGDGGDDQGAGADYWRMIDIGFAVRTADGGQANYTDIVDFDGDGDVDIVVSEGFDGLVLYPNSGSGSFFESGNRVLLLDPADVDPGALGHWADRFQVVATFGLADYNRDGNLDAVVEGQWQGSPSLSEPMVFLAYGNGSSLDPVLLLRPDPPGSAVHDESSFMVTASLDFRRNSGEVLWSMRAPAHRSQSLVSYIHDLSCEHGIAHTDAGSQECLNATAHGHLMTDLSTWNDLPNLPEFDVASTPRGSYLLRPGGSVFSDRRAQREFWGVDESFDRLWAHNARFGGDGYSQAAIGEFEPGIYGTVQFYRGAVFGPDPGFAGITPNFENVSPLSEAPFEKIDIPDGEVIGGTALDVDRDGLDDLIISTARGDTVDIDVWTNLGDYVFERTGTLRRIEAPFGVPEWVRLKQYDFDRDGRMDLYVQGLGKILIAE